ALPGAEAIWLCSGKSKGSRPSESGRNRAMPDSRIGSAGLSVKPTFFWFVQAVLPMLTPSMSSG
ncbi:hypothetical protein ACWTQY_32425, partial [Klebsiella pneumoniae]